MTPVTDDFYSLIFSKRDNIKHLKTLAGDYVKRLSLYKDSYAMDTIYGSCIA